MEDFDKELDTSGVSCPMPLLRVKKTLKSMSSGQTLRVTTTDPGSVKDFKTFADDFGHELLETQENDGKYYFLLKKG